VQASLGKGGTAPVFEVVSPGGALALKIYDANFSSGAKGEIEHRRIEQQLALKGHDCPYLVQIYDGGSFEGRLFLLMGRALGSELATRLRDIPRGKIRQIVDQVTRAVLFLKGKGLCHRDIKAANVFISDDFEHCTLLDISVIRNVTDPIGLGTDHEGQLPVVATARYSPPEYLFRLMEPGPELWHALNVYQLGALLHDLIIQEPLFQDEYLGSTLNRYRFAWIVATVDPNVQADDVDRDLVLTARRALDKDWQRRSLLTLEDFLADSAVHKAKALQLLGFAIDQNLHRETDNLTGQLQRVREVASELENGVTEYLRRNGIIAYHAVRPGPYDSCKLLVFRWSASVDLRLPPDIELQLELRLLARGSIDYLGVSAKLCNQGRTVSMALPELQDDAGLGQRLFADVVDMFEKLAMDSTRSGAVVLEKG